MCRIVGQTEIEVSPAKLRTRWGVCMGDSVSISDVGKSMPFLFSSSKTWTTPVRSGLLLNASAHACERQN